MPKIGSDYTTISSCRGCDSDRLEVVLELGNMPLSDGLVPPEFDRKEEVLYPLTLVWCPECTLVQILETVDPRTLYGEEYPYYSSFSPRLVEHARKNVEGIIDRTGVGVSSLVVELASNDGYLLQWFAGVGIPVLGVDPAPGPAAAAEARGIKTICDFFDLALAERLRAEGRQADVIVGNNVLAHVPNQNAFVAAIEALLAPNGTVVLEFPYVRDLIDDAEFDTIYHEHHCYFSVSAVRRLFRTQGLELVKVEHLSIHGGSLRVYFERDGEPDGSVAEFAAEEESIGMLGADYYRGFAKKVQEIKTDLVELLRSLTAQGKTVAAYGAAAKGAILLNYCGIGDDLISFVVDRNVHKHGWEMPGQPLLIHDTEYLKQDPPDYLLLLAWNFKDEIMEQQAWFGQQGGRSIVPIPTPTVL